MTTHLYVAADRVLTDSSGGLDSGMAVAIRAFLAQLPGALEEHHVTVWTGAADVPEREMVMLRDLLAVPGRVDALVKNSSTLRLLTQEAKDGVDVVVVDDQRSFLDALIRDAADVPDFAIEAWEPRDFIRHFARNVALAREAGVDVNFGEEMKAAAGSGVSPDSAVETPPADPERELDPGYEAPTASPERPYSSIDGSRYGAPPPVETRGAPVSVQGSSTTAGTPLGGPVNIIAPDAKAVAKGVQAAPAPHAESGVASFNRTLDEIAGREASTGGPSAGASKGDDVTQETPEEARRRVEAEADVRQAAIDESADTERARELADDDDENANQAGRAPYTPGVQDPGQRAGDGPANDPDANRIARQQAAEEQDRLVPGQPTPDVGAARPDVAQGTEEQAARPGDDGRRQQDHGPV